MYRCEICKQVTKAGEKQHKKVVKTRNKIYHNTDKYGKEIITEGYETVKEINVCDKCYEKEMLKDETNKKKHTNTAGTPQNI